MRKHRKIETAEERNKRTKRAAKVKIQDAESADNAVDAKIKWSIDNYGP